MNRETLRSQASRRRSGEMPVAEEPKKGGWTCHHCGRTLQHEKVFFKHHCMEKVRFEELRTPIGQAAFSYFNEWMRAKKRSTQSLDTFSTSRYYTTFLKFAQHVIKTKLPDPEAFIQLMCRHGNDDPGLWCRDEIYSIYLKVYDKAVPPITQFLRTIDELKALSKDHGVELKDVFVAVGPSALADLIRRKKLTFWGLMASTRFKSYLLKLPHAEQSWVADAINVHAASIRIGEDALLFAEFVRAMAEEGL